MNHVIGNDIDTRGFSIRTAHYLAYASKLAYAETARWAARLGLRKRIAMFTCGQFHGFVGHLDKAAVLAFRGTQNIRNCLTDAETPLVSHSPYPGRVHLGFAQAVEEVWPQVRRLLGAPSMPVWVTGHSLGAAMATLASVRLAREGHAIGAVYTYGSPRVGDRIFREAYRLPNYRFVNDCDLVPHLPFLWCYKHVGELKLFDHLGNLQEERAIWKSKKRALASKAKHVQRVHRRAAAHHHELTEFDWLSDHHLDRYLAAILKALSHLPQRNWQHPADGAGPVPAPSLRFDSGVPQITPPRVPRHSGHRSAISESQLVAAFLDQQPAPFRPTATLPRQGRDSG